MLMLMRGKCKCCFFHMQMNRPLGGIVFRRECLSINSNWKIGTAAALAVAISTRRCFVAPLCAGQPAPSLLTFNPCFSNLQSLVLSHQSTTANMRAFSRFLLFCAVSYPILIFLTNSIAPYCFRFVPSKLQELSKKAIAEHPNDTKALFRSLVKDLQVEYPGIVADYDENTWVFNVESYWSL